MSENNQDLTLTLKIIDGQKSANDLKTFNSNLDNSQKSFNNLAKATNDFNAAQDKSAKIIKENEETLKKAFINNNINALKDNINSSILSLKTQQVELQKSSNAFKDHNLIIQNAIDIRKNELSGINQNINTYKEQKAAITGKTEADKENIKNINDNITKLKDQKTSITSVITELKAQKAESQANIDNLNSQNKTIQTNISELRNLKTALNNTEDASKANRMSMVELNQTVNLLKSSVRGFFLAIETLVSNNPFIEFDREFEKNLYNINSISFLTTNQLSDLKDQIVDIGAKNQYSGLKELSSAFYQATSSGYKLADSLQLVKTADLAALSGLADTKEQLESSVAVLHGYSLGVDQAGHVNDVFLKTVQSGVITLPQFNKVIGNMITLAPELHQNIESVTAALIAFTKFGLTPQTSATIYNAILTGFIKQGGEAKELAKELKLDLSSAVFETKSFPEVIKEIVNKTGSNPEIIAKLFGNQREIKAFFKLARNEGDTFQKYYQDQLNLSSGAVAKSAEEQRKSFDQSMKRLKDSFEITMQRFGEIAISGFEPFVHGADNALKKFNELPPAIKDTIAEIAIVTTTAGSLGFALISLSLALGAVNTLLPLISTGFGQITTAAKVFLAFAPEIAVITGAIILLNEDLKLYQAQKQEQDSWKAEHDSIDLAIKKVKELKALEVQRKAKGSDLTGQEKIDYSHALVGSLDAVSESQRAKIKQLALDYSKAGHEMLNSQSEAEKAHTKITLDELEKRDKAYKKYQQDKDKFSDLASEAGKTPIQKERIRAQRKFTSDESTITEALKSNQLQGDDRIEAEKALRALKIGFAEENKALDKKEAEEKQKLIEKAAKKADKTIEDSYKIRLGNAKDDITAIEGLEDISNEDRIKGINHALETEKGLYNQLANEKGLSEAKKTFFTNKANEDQIKIRKNKDQFDKLELAQELTDEQDQMSIDLENLKKQKEKTESIDLKTQVNLRDYQKLTTSEYIEEERKRLDLHLGFLEGEILKTKEGSKQRKEIEKDINDTIQKLNKNTSDEEINFINEVYKAYDKKQAFKKTINDREKTDIDNRNKQNENAFKLEQENDQQHFDISQNLLKEKADNLEKEANLIKDNEDQKTKLLNDADQLKKEIEINAFEREKKQFEKQQQFIINNDKETYNNRLVALKKLVDEKIKLYGKDSIEAKEATKQVTDFELTEINKRIGELTKLGETLKNSSIEGVKSLGSFISGFADNLSKIQPTIDNFKKASQGDPLAIMQLGNEAISELSKSLNSGKEAWNEYQKAQNGGTEANAHFLKSQEDLMRSIPFIGNMLQDLSDSILHLFNIETGAELQQKLDNDKSAYLEFSQFISSQDKATSEEKKQYALDVLKDKQSKLNDENISEASKALKSVQLLLEYTKTVEKIDNEQSAKERQDGIDHLTFLAGQENAGAAIKIELAKKVLEDKQEKLKLENISDSDNLQKQKDYLQEYLNSVDKANRDEIDLKLKKRQELNDLESDEVKKLKENNDIKKALIENSLDSEELKLKKLKALNESYIKDSNDLYEKSVKDRESLIDQVTKKAIEGSTKEFQAQKTVLTQQSDVLKNNIRELEYQVDKIKEKYDSLRETSNTGAASEFDTLSTGILNDPKEKEKLLYTSLTKFEADQKLQKDTLDIEELRGEITHEKKLTDLKKMSAEANVFYSNIAKQLPTDSEAFYEFQEKALGTFKDFKGYYDDYLTEKQNDETKPLDKQIKSAQTDLKDLDFKLGDLDYSINQIKDHFTSIGEDWKNSMNDSMFGPDGWITKFNDFVDKDLAQKITAVTQEIGNIKSSLPVNTPSSGNITPTVSNNVTTPTATIDNNSIPGHLPGETEQQTLQRFNTEDQANWDASHPSQFNTNSNPSFNQGGIIGAVTGAGSASYSWNPFDLSSSQPQSSWNPFDLSSSQPQSSWNPFDLNSHLSYGVGGIAGKNGPEFAMVGENGQEPIFPPGKIETAFDYFNNMRYLESPKNGGGSGDLAVNVYVDTVYSDDSRDITKVVKAVRDGIDHIDRLQAKRS